MKRFKLLILAFGLVVMAVLVIVSGLMVWEPLAAILDQSVTILSGV